MRFTRALMARVAVDVVALAATQASALQHTDKPLLPVIPLHARPHHRHNSHAMAHTATSLDLSLTSFSSGQTICTCACMACNHA